MQNNDNKIIDFYNRKFEYVRLSITNKCNFRCKYCLPNGYKKTNSDGELSIPEIEKLVTALSELGVWKIRITGGEPTVRKDFLDIARCISKIQGIKYLSMTTNGYRLEKIIHDCSNAGIKNINLSIDSLDAKEFFDITGHDKLDSLLRSIEIAEKIGIKMKINVVLLKSYSGKSIDSFLDFVKDKNLSLRFIELMPTADNKEFFNINHIRATEIEKKLLQENWVKLAKESNSGPAIVYGNAAYLGTIGLIAPYSNEFCKSCNRLRVNSSGKLILCLFGNGYYDLRPFLQSNEQKHELKNLIVSLVKTRKPPQHNLLNNQYGKSDHFASIGG